jgi:STE24 endopeptidase
MHTLLQALFVTLGALATFYLTDRLFPLVQQLTGADDVQGLADPAGLPIIAIIVTVLGLLATPISNAGSRFFEADADRFSLARANEPDGLARALVKTIEYRAASPSPVEEFIFYSHPSVGSRIRRCMDWKATHPVGSVPASKIQKH